jgi:hypothetical protein
MGSLSSRLRGVNPAENDSTCPHSSAAKIKRTLIIDVMSNMVMNDELVDEEEFKWVVRPTTR